MRVQFANRWVGCMGQSRGMGYSMGAHSTWGRVCTIACECAYDTVACARACTYHVFGVTSRTPVRCGCFLQYASFAPGFTLTRTGGHRPLSPETAHHTLPSFRWRLECAWPEKKNSHPKTVAVIAAEGRSRVLLLRSQQGAQQPSVAVCAWPLVDSAAAAVHKCAPLRRPPGSCRSLPF